MLSDDIVPGVRRTHADGSLEHLPPESVQGLDDFIAGIEVNTDMPPEFSLSGWQMSDEAHRGGDGKPAYRVVYKTIRTAPSVPTGVVASNCRVLFTNDKVTWGEPRFGRALTWRRPDRFLLPDWGITRFDPLLYTRCKDDVIPMEGHQETTPPMNHVEILYVLADEAAALKHQERLATARAAIAPLLASLDLSFGPRLLGVRITEELGEVFDDWHWNRRLDGRTVALEAQAEFRVIDGDAASAQIAAIFDVNTARTEEERARLRTAAQWYWRAEAEDDPVLEFVSHWLTIESLEMDDTNIGPVKASVRALVRSNRNIEAVGRLFGLRGKLVHGKSRSVSARQTQAIRAVAHALLERRLLGVVAPEKREALESALEDVMSPSFAA